MKELEKKYPRNLGKKQKEEFPNWFKHRASIFWSLCNIFEKIFWKDIYMISIFFLFGSCRGRILKNAQNSCFSYLAVLNLLLVFIVDA